MKETEKKVNIKNEEQLREEQKQKTLRNLKTLIIKIVILLIIAFVFFGFIFGITRMGTSYMNPYLTDGDLLFFYRLDRKFELGDVVYLKHNKKEYVLRIVAKPGQTVDIDTEGVLLIDGRPEVHKSYYDTKKIEDSSITFPYKVETGKYFVLNDYRLQLEDSRLFGAISESSIIGKVIGRVQVRNF